MSGALDIIEAGEGEAAQWDAFVEASPAASFFHRWGWSRVIRETYGYRALMLAARDEGRIVAVLPLIDVASPLMGRALISTAFTVGGGVVGRSDAACAMLAEAARAAGAERGARYVELRGFSPGLEGWASKSTVYAGFEKSLPGAEAENWAMIPRARRANIRKGIELEKEGALRVSVGADVDAFHRVYAQAAHEHGTPVFPKKFAAALLREFAGAADILLLEASGAPVLALLSFYFRDRVLPYYVGISPFARERRLYDFATWRHMRHAAARGGRIYDFGRSKVGSGAYDYKMFWGFEPKPLDYRYALIGASAAPNVNPDNPKFAAFVGAWKRLPGPVAAAAGPLLARHLA